MSNQSATGGSVTGGVTGGIKGLLRLEGLVVLAVASLAYGTMGGSWWIFAVLFLVPDLSMLGYLRGPKLGAALYNLGHSYITPLAFGAVAMSQAPEYQIYALIWIAHIGFDRALGYGLKYSSSFGATHLGVIGKLRAAAKATAREAAA